MYVLYLEIEILLEEFLEKKELYEGDIWTRYGLSKDICEDEFASETLPVTKLYYYKDDLTLREYDESESTANRIRLESMKIYLQQLVNQLLTNVIDDANIATYFKEEVKKLYERVYSCTVEVNKDTLLEMKYKKH